MEKIPSCKDIRALTDEYIEGELTDAEMRAVEAHIAECEECRREFEELFAIKAAIRSSSADMPEGLHSRIMTAVRAESASKPRRKSAFFRGAAISAACVALCLCSAAVLTMMPLWQENEGGNLPEDPICSVTVEAAEKVETLPSVPADTAAEEPETMAEVTPTPEDIVTDAVESVEEELTFTVAESAAPPVESMSDPLEMTAAPEMTAAGGMTAMPETMAKPETDAPSEAETTEKHYFKGDTVTVPTYDASSEKLSAPGGEEITMALLVVSGLLAVASFIAFLISLSSVRTTAHKKDGEEK